MEEPEVNLQSTLQTRASFRRNGKSILQSRVVKINAPAQGFLRISEIFYLAGVKVDGKK